jgi:hypothetical protein
VDMDVDPEPPCKLGGVVGTRIVDQDEAIGDAGRNIGDRALERGFRPVGGHGDDDFRREVCSPRPQMSRSPRHGDTLRR